VEKQMSSSLEQVRNVILVGHANTGKTTLAEAMMHTAGAIPRMGTIDQGNTVCDFDELEKERKHSIESALAPLDYRGVQITVIDTPGFSDFVGQALCALVGAETAIVVVSAAGGIEVNTRKMMAAAADYGLARVIVINKIDAPNLDLAGLVQNLRETFGTTILPLNLPAENGTKVVNCLTGQAGQAVDFDDLESAKLALTESIVESDEALMERYLGGEEITADELTAALRTAITSGAVVPVLFAAGQKEIGVTDLLDLIVSACPSPLQGVKRKIETGEGETKTEEEIKPDPAGPLIGQVFKVFSDPRSNIKYAAVRLHSGTIKSDTSFRINDDRRAVRAGHIYRTRGGEHTEMSEMSAGQICTLAKIDELQIGDTVQTATPGRIAMPALPIPMYALAIEPKSRGDEQKISGALSRLSEEEKAFRVERDRQTGELVIAGLGDLHLRVILERMARRFKLEVNTKLPKIPYKETITVPAEGHYRHKKQTGGAGQFAEVYLKVEPLERNGGFEFVDDIFGGAIPGQFLPAIEKGVRDQMETGIVAGFPLQDVRVRVYDGKHHPVDSKEIAFRIAGKLAVKDAFSKGKPALLEPIVNIEVIVPSQFVGDITGDLSGRRGRILGQEVLPGGMTSIKALVPLAEVAQYNSQLRSVTGGQGSYTMEFSHYDPVPPNIQQEIIKQYQPKEEDEEK